MANQIITNLISTRLSTDSSFLPEDWVDGLKEYNSYIKATYIDTGKILSRNQTISEDGLTRTVVTVWVNDEERLKYLEDPIAAKRLADIVEYFKETPGVDVMCINQEVADGEVIREWQVDY
jgi:hypothetical protein